jgi:hypothetical protein
METHLLFIDESGSDEGKSPYHVLAGVDIEVRRLWPFTQEVWKLQQDYFGCILREEGMPELKGKNMLGRGGYQKAKRTGYMPQAIRKELVEKLVEKHISGLGQKTERTEYSAWAQSLIDYADGLLRLCVEWDLKVFATLFAPNTPRPAPDEARRFLGKEVMFLLQRYHAHLCGYKDGAAGLMIMDEIGRSRCKKSLSVISGYFARTEHGKEWADVIVPEPFYVRSELTTMIHIADIVAYIINWGYRTGPINEPAREEMLPFGKYIREMTVTTETTDGEGKTWRMWSIHFIQDLRPSGARGED